MRALLFAIGLTLLSDTTFQSQLSAAPGEKEPIALVGHGAMLDDKGKHITASKEFVLSAQQYYLQQLKQATPRTALKAFEAYTSSLDKLPEKAKVDDVMREALKLNWLLQRVASQHANPIKAKLATLNRRYLIDVVRIDPGKTLLDYHSGLPHYMLQYAGVVKGSMLRQTTNANGQQYIDECRKAGVPIPPRFENGNWDSGGWTDNGVLTPDFLTPSGTTDVYFHKSETPAGTCIALPRRNGKDVGLMGLICLSRDTGKACFWDRAGGTLDQGLTINDFVGGVDLTAGVCSDCHAGENPFIIHPDSALDLGTALLSSPSWHDPLMKPSWPQNPGPLTLLDLVPLGEGENSCLDCHFNLYAGRFPQVGELPGYCSTVLGGAINNTMPPRPAGMSAMDYLALKDTYKTHSDALLAFCQQPPPDGAIVPVDTPKEDPTFLSPPVIIEPLYECAEAIEVQSVIYGAELEVFIDGVPLSPIKVVEPSKQIVKVPPLIDGQELTAVQTKNGVTSDKSAIALVRSHTKDYPAGLPKPVIDPQLIHQCGNMIAVRHVRGAKITTYVNAANPSAYYTGGDWTDLPPKIRPFNLGDSYTAEQSMCGDISPQSDQEVAVAPPSPMPVPQLKNGPPVAGQELIDIKNLAHGARTTVEVSGAGEVAAFSTAISRKSEVNIAAGLGSPLVAGQSISILSNLCEATKIGLEPVRPCDDIPAPQIQQPLVGNTSITVTDAIPGARILVFDDNGMEIGDSSGVLVALSRALVPGDVLTIVQKVGNCISKDGYRVSVMCTSLEQGCQ